MISTLIFAAYVLLFVVMIVATAWLLISVIQVLFGVSPFIPVQNHALDAIVSEIAVNGLGNSSETLTDRTPLLIDIGCGDAKVLVHASRKFPTLRMIGIERNPLPYLIAQWKTRNHPNIQIVRADLFHYDYSKATHLYAYLFPEVMDRLLPRLKNQVAPGTALVSCDFPFSQKEAVRVQEIAPGQKKTFAKKLLTYTF